MRSGPRIVLMLVVDGFALNSSKLSLYCSKRPVDLLGRDTPILARGSSRHLSALIILPDPTLKSFPLAVLAGLETVHHLLAVLDLGDRAAQEGYLAAGNREQVIVEVPALVIDLQAG